MAVDAARAGSTSTVSDWTCACGQDYRVAVLPGRGPTFWARNSPAGYCPDGLCEGTACVRCGEPLRAP